MSETKQLSDEELEKISGGSNPPSEGVAYLVLMLAAMIEFGYKTWLSSTPNATQEQKYAQAKIIAQEALNNVPEKGRKALDEYFAENPDFWNNMVKNVVDNN